MKTDQRYERTEKKIRESFFELLKKSSLHEITVKEIIAHAGINRATFYLHYQDKYALQEQIESEMFSEIFEIITGEGKVSKGDDGQNSREQFTGAIGSEYMIPPTLEQIRKISVLMEKNRNRMQLMADSDVAGHFIDAYFLKNKEWMDEQFDSIGDPVAAQYLMSVLKGMITGMLSAWFARDFQENAEEFFRMYVKVVSMIRGMIGKILS